MGTDTLTDQAQLADSDAFVVLAAAPTQFMMVGDSNDVGQGDPAKADTALGVPTADAGVLFNGRYASGSAVDPPVWTDFSVDGVMRTLAPRSLFGFEISFGKTLKAILSPLVPAIPSTGISGSTLNDNWLNTSTFMLVSTGTNLFNTVNNKDHTFEASLHRKTVAVLVSLGTNDAALTGPASAFQANMTATIAAWRATFGPNLIVAWIKTNAGTTGSFLSTVRTAQVNVAAGDPKLFLVENDDCPLLGDGLHYQANSYWTVGERAAFGVLDLLGYARRTVAVPTAIGWGPQEVGSGDLAPRSYAGVRDGDIEILIVQTGQATGTGISLPTGGWIQAGATTNTSGSGVFAHFAVFWRWVTAAMLAANGGHTTNTLYTHADTENAAKIFAIRSTNKNPTIDASALFAANVFSASMSIPPITTVAANCGVFVWAGGWAGGAGRAQVVTNGTLTGFSQLQDGCNQTPDSNAQVLALAAGTLASPGTTGTTSVTVTGPSGSVGFGVTLSIRDNSMANVTRDAASGVYCPANATEWSIVMAVAGIPTGGPFLLWLCQESSGSLADSVGTFTGTAAGSPLTYRQAVSGWTRLGISGVDGGGGIFTNTDAGLPDPATTSFLSLGYVLLSASSTAGTNLSLVGTASVTSDIFGASPTKYRILSSGSPTGTANPIGAVRPYGFLYDVTNNRVAAWSDQEVLSVTRASTTGKKHSVFTTFPGATLYRTAFSGVNAELSNNQVRSLLTTLGWSPAW